MKFSIDSVKKYLPKRLHSSSLPDAALMHPAREWNIGITVSVIFFLCSVFGAWAAYAYYGTINIDTKATSVEVFNYKRSDVLAALERFGQKEEGYQQLLGQAPLVESEPVVEVSDIPTEAALIEQGLLGTDGQILPQFPTEEALLPPEEGGTPAAPAVSE